MEPCNRRREASCFKIPWQRLCQPIEGDSTPNPLVGWKNNATGELRWVKDVQEDAKPFSFSGIHIIEPSIFNMMPSSGVFSIIDVYLKCAASNLIVGYDHSGDRIIDVGKPESIAEAEKLFGI